jgi:hypothetical protein
MEDEPWSDSFRTKTLQKVEVVISKELRDLEDEIAGVYEKMFGALVRKASVLITPTLLGTALAGLSPGQILAFSTAAITGALGMTVPEFVDVWLAERKLRRNGLAFLLAATKNLSP